MYKNKMIVPFVDELEMNKQELMYEKICETLMD